MVNILGDPNTTNMPDCEKFPNFIQFEARSRLPLKKIIIGTSEETINLIEKMLRYDPIERISAEQLLQ